MGVRADTGSGPPEVPEDFWEHERMMAALDARHIGRVLKAYRTHPYHGRHPLSQELMAEWLGTSQSQLSRVENGQNVDSLDLLTHWARVLRIPDAHLWFVRPTMVEPTSTPSPTGFGERSAQRTREIRTSLDMPASDLGYRAPEALFGAAVEYVRSSSRVFVVAGPPGCGKTLAAYHLADQLSSHADVQVHSTAAWNTLGSDLAADVLRYASVAAGGDTWLALEEAVSGLDRPCVVVVDGLADRGQIDDVCRQVDRALRQVTTARLKYVLMVRTPPEVDLTAFPVLAASRYRAPTGADPVSHRLSPWSSSEARSVWDGSRQPGDVTFSELPPSLQGLATVPLYMQLLKDSGEIRSDGPADVFWLVDECVRSALRWHVADVDATIEAMADAAVPDASDVVPQALRVFAAGAKSSGAVSRPSPVAAQLRRSVPGHDVVGEYLVATRVARAVIDHGPSSAVVGAFNDLATRSATSAGARGLFEMLVRCLERQAPDILGYVALSPRADATAMLPLLIEFGASGAWSASGEVWRTLCRRSTGGPCPELTRALLSVATLTHALGEDLAPWLADVLRAHGVALWAEVGAFVERHACRSATTALRSLLRDTNEGAAFCARFHPLLFTGERGDDVGLEYLLTHRHWQVRAALAEGLDDLELTTSRGRDLLERLVADPDYKVRSAAAATMSRAPAALVRQYLSSLLADESWHVRTHVLAALDSRGSDARDIVHDVARAVAGDAQWECCPTPAAVALERLLLQCNLPTSPQRAAARERALFGLLREARSRSIAVDRTVLGALLVKAGACNRWPLAAEANRWGALGANGEPTSDRSPNEEYRALRGRRVVQVALDVPELDRAVAVAAAAVAGGASLVEVGDPLIKEVGLGAVEAVKRQVPDATVVAEMMSADWGRDQVTLAAEAGADVAFLIGPASLASVSAAVEAGRRLGVPVVLDVPPGDVVERWVRDMEKAGVDGFAVTTNIDLGVGGTEPFARASAVRRCSRLPVAVSGGFTPSDHEIIAQPDWDVLVVGRSIADAVRPDRAARHIVDVASGTRSVR